MRFRLFLLGTCYRCSRMFTSFCCRGPRSSTTTRTATSQHAVCCGCNPTTQHSPGVFMPLLLWVLVYYVNNWLHTEASVLNSTWISIRCIYGVEPRFFITITKMKNWHPQYVLFPLSLLWFMNIVSVFIQGMPLLYHLQSLWVTFVTNAAQVPLTSLHCKHIINVIYGR